MTPAEFSERVEQIAWHLAADYDFYVDPDDLKQQMWLTYYEKQAASDAWTEKEPVSQLNFMGWRARDWARHQFVAINKNASTGSERDQDQDDWEFVALETESLDPLLSLAETETTDPLERLLEADQITERAALVARVLALLADQSEQTHRVATGLMAGKTKHEIAQELKVGESAVSYHVKRIKHTFAFALSQVGA